MPSPMRRWVGRLKVIAGLLVLAAPLIILIRSADPKTTGPQGAAAIVAEPTNPTLSPVCARTAHNRDELAHEFAVASPGQTVCLTSGRYGKFLGGVKSGMVGVRAQEGAKAVMSIDFDSAVNVRLDNVVVTSALITGMARNITIAGSRFTGLARVDASQFDDANIVFDGNTHMNINTCASCYQGRLHIDGKSGHPSGVVVKNSKFSGGNSDGVRADADGIQVIGNTFSNFRDKNPFHTDPIQIYGGTHILIRGNFFHDNAVSAQIMMADGGSKNVVEDNVVSGTGYTWAITWFSDNGSIIRHNTFTDGQCNDKVRCGMLNLGAKAADPAGHGTIIRDNILSGISNGGESKQSAYDADHNLTVEATQGQHNMIGRPKYRGPLGTLRGYRLASGSLGASRGSNGSDLGIR